MTDIVTDAWSTTQGFTALNFTETSELFTETTTVYDRFPQHEKTWQVVLIILASVLLSFVTFTANVMVWMSFYMDKQLQVVNNYFLLSLSVADMIIASISMPLYTVYIVKSWTLGPVVCDIWLSIDYVASNASVMNLVVICFDRYFSITKPLTYRANRTPRKAKIMIATAWSVSVIIWVPLIIGWPRWNKRTVAENDCYIQFLEEGKTLSAVLNCVTISIAFYLPVILMCYIYYKIWRETEKRSKELRHLQAGEGDGYAASKRLLVSDPDKFQYENTKKSWKKRLMCYSDVGVDDELEDSSDAMLPPLPSTSTTNTSSTKSRNTISLSPKSSPSQKQKNGNLISSENVEHNFAASLYTILIKLPDENAKNENDNNVPKITMVEYTPRTAPPTILQDKDTGPNLLSPVKQDSSNRPSSVCVVPPNTKSCPSNLSIHAITAVKSAATKAKASNAVKKKRTVLIREKKAARTLIAILLAFVITWTPYSVLVIVNALKPGGVNARLYTISYWGCYLNSTINPICYALCNMNFRRAFKQILTCKFRKKHQRMRTKQLQIGSNQKMNSSR
ncbi:muscarinic acetylcholine receptor M1-like [Anneissia japonica]|uniref:muscarinic acetylcholine receptor M1-like n=1 Tax=Anneissia japonica TaxID=1529436 RepID=UPI0014257B58|nr:muscarinic acetylcholine receptor M1-like [Anneissia japonica]XP_033102880.1 muscarinic acetylcholine receptor M1-like [Anneissia japonica]XP_033102881.1 muscarinic acetylcholine receptor M1-like [Anneissia japonica]XP_033102882.1 muscarinic acetylcholine receptor M1-like [Anneissia japonica]XP_033102884.1 muscarinic acetylcholine receptor M1-like [Anneissia japonica]